MSLSAIIITPEVLVEMSHAHEDVYEDKTEIRAEGALDAGSEAGHSLVAFGWTGVGLLKQDRFPPKKIIQS